MNGFWTLALVALVAYLIGVKMPQFGSMIFAKVGV